jgi:hypothetical protein
MSDLIGLVLMKEQNLVYIGNYLSETISPHECACP